MSQSASWLGGGSLPKNSSSLLAFGLEFQPFVPQACNHDITGYASAGS